MCKDLFVSKVLFFLERWQIKRNLVLRIQKSQNDFYSAGAWCYFLETNAWQTSQVSAWNLVCQLPIQTVLLSIWLVELEERHCKVTNGKLKMVHACDDKRRCALWRRRFGAWVLLWNLVKKSLMKGKRQNLISKVKNWRWFCLKWLDILSIKDFASRMSLDFLSRFLPESFVETCQKDWA